MNRINRVEFEWFWFAQIEFFFKANSVRTNPMPIRSILICTKLKITRIGTKTYFGIARNGMDRIFPIQNLHKDIEISIRYLWQKFRIEIHSEPIRNFSNHSRNCIWTKQFHSDLIQNTLEIMFDEKWLKINPTRSDLIRDASSNESELSFQSESILIRTDISRIFNPNQSD